MKTPFRPVSVAILCLLLCIAGRSNAQERDFKLWLSADMEARLSKHFDLDVEVSNRWGENATSRSESFVETELEYSRKWFSTGIGYRFEDKNDPESGYKLGHRVNAFAEVEAEAGRFTLSYRNKFQSEYFSVRSSENGKIPNSYDRNRIKLDYNIKKIPVKPFILCEVFSRVNRNEAEVVSKGRFGTGLDWKITSKQKLGISFYYDHEKDIPLSNTDYIFSADYSFKLN
jgi:hypothetical protein